MACSCKIDRDIQDLAGKSKTIYYGEVIAIEKIGDFVKSGEKQQYKVTLQPQDVLKGKAKKKYSYVGWKFYNDKDSKNPRTGDCGLDLSFGEKYMVLLEKGREPQWSMCSEHILPRGSKRFTEFVDRVQAPARLTAN